MKILVAEDEENIASMYELALKTRGHKVTMTNNGRACVDEYKASRNKSNMYELVILDYRMPVMDGHEAAQSILELNPDQRIIFASAFARDTLIAVIKQDGIIAEILQKPFEIDVLLDTVENSELYFRLQKLKINVGDLRKWNPSHRELSDLLDALLRLKDAQTVFSKLEGQRGMRQPNSVEANGKPKTRSESEDSRMINALIEDALKYLGSDWINTFYYHLDALGVPRDQIADNPGKFSEALESLLHTASDLVKLQILKTIDSNQDLISRSAALGQFRQMLTVGASAAATGMNAEMSGGKRK
ncbi:MAG TPA: response regulator [Nitrososphaera sp.]|nr:response regulator [Nitrososphaera sp.]